MTARTLATSALLLGMLLLIGYTACGPASASPIPGPEFSIASVSTSARSSQEYVDVCAGNGIYLAVWQDRRSNQDYDIYGILLNADGTPVTAESFLISKMAGGAPAPNDQLYPAVGFNGTYFLVAWADRRGVNLVYRIYGSRVTTTGDVLDPDGIAFPTAATPTDQFAAQIASNGTNWEVVWQEKSSMGSDDVYGAVVNPSGTVSNRIAIAYRADNEQWPAIAWNGTNYLVVWQDYRNSESTGTDIYGSRLNSLGQKIALSEKMISTAPGSSTNGAPGAQSVPSVAVSSAGVWLVVWQDARGADDDIYCARVSSAGTLQDLGGVMVSSVTDDQEEPSVGWDGTYFLAAWRDKNSSRSIRGARINTSAQVLDPSGIALIATSAGSYGPAVAGQNGSSVVGMYTLDMTPDIFGVAVNSAGQVGSLSQWSLCLQDQPHFSAAFDGTNYTVVWSDRRSGMYCVYAARVSTSGTVLDPGGVLVTTTVVGDQTQPAIAWDGANYLVVWTEMGATSTDIKGMRLTSALARVDASPLNLCVVGMDQNSPAVAWSGTTWLVAWVDYRSAVAPNYYCDIRGARVSSAGVIAAVSAIGGADNNQFAPAVASCGGNFLVAWEDYRIGSSVVYCNRVTSAGTVQDGIGIQVPAMAYYNVQPKVASDGTNYFIVWSDKRDGWSNDNIYGVRMSTDAARLDPADIVICGATKAQVAPCAFWNGTNYLVAWQDYRNSSTTGYDIYMNQVSPDGVVGDPLDRLIAGGPQSEVNPSVLVSGSSLGLILYSNFINATYRTAGRVLSEPPPVPVVTDDGAYTASSSSLHATWSAAPREAEVAEYRYAIGTTPGGADIVGWTSAGLLTEVTHVGLSLGDGVSYFFSVEARNTVGMWGDPGVSDGIMVDASAPTTPVVTDDGSYSTSSTTLHAIWSSADPHTGILEYLYAIGTSAGGSDVVGWTSTGTGAEITRSDLSLVDGTTYFFSVQAQNGAGAWSAIGTSDGILVDSTAPALPTVTDDGEYTTSTTTLHATWTSPDPETSIEEYQYAIGTSAEGTDVLDWTSTGTEAEVTNTGLSLSEGVTYYISVKARNAAGLWSGIGSSDGIMVDVSAPTTPVVTDDGAFTTSRESLHATWSSSDPQSGIEEYRYAIGTSADGTDILDWTSAGLTTEMTETGLSLTDGTTYYFSVQAKNGVGIWSGSGSSDGIMVDGSGPSIPVVTDDGDYTQSLDTLHATWSAADPHSGIAEYRYAIGTLPGWNDVVDWTSAGTDTEVTETGLTLAEGTAYCFSVEARNGAGIWSAWGASDGIGVEASPPTTPVVTDDGDYTPPDSLHATWTSTDPHTGIQEYKYAIGTSAGGNDVVDWTSAGTDTEVTRTDLTLVDGTTYFFSVQAQNGAGLWSSTGSSDGITIDASAPTTPVVTDDGNYALPTRLHATWSADDPDSGIAEYSYAIGTSAGGNDTADWTSAGTATEVTRTGLSLSEGTTYYIGVKAQNGAGLWSEIGSSDGIAVPPECATILEAKFMPNGQALRLSGKVVTAGTAGLPDLPGLPYFYIGQVDRVTGVKVVSPETIPTGGIVDIAGVIETVDGERQITASDVQVVSTSGIVPGALNMMDRAIGGAQLNQYTPGVLKSSGPHNVGSLVKTWGKVTYVGGAGEDYFYVNGGSFLRDGSGYVGVKVYCGALTKPAVDSTVLVTGISSCEPLSSELVRRVLATQIIEYP